MYLPFCLVGGGLPSVPTCSNFKDEERLDDFHHVYSTDEGKFWRLKFQDWAASSVWSLVSTPPAWFFHYMAYDIMDPGVHSEEITWQEGIQRDSVARLALFITTFTQEN